MPCDSLVLHSCFVSVTDTSSTCVTLLSYRISSSMEMGLRMNCYGRFLGCSWSSTIGIKINPEKHKINTRYMSLKKNAMDRQTDVQRDGHLEIVFTIHSLCLCVYNNMHSYNKYRDISSLRLTHIDLNINQYHMHTEFPKIRICYK